MNATLTDDSDEPRQLSRADLASLTPQQIVAAKQAGRLRDVLDGVDVPDSGLDAPPDQISREALASMSAKEIVQAKAEGRLARLLGETPA